MEAANNQIQGTQWTYLLGTVLGRPGASMNVKSWLRGAPDLCPLCDQPNPGPEASYKNASALFRKIQPEVGLTARRDP